MTLDELETAVQVAKAAYGGDAVVHVELDGNDVLLSAGAHPASRGRHAAMVTGFAAGFMLPSADSVGHGMYLAQRAIGDGRAYRRGRLPQRLVRRAVSKRLMRGLWGS
jgi:hypothetical protein